MHATLKMFCWWFVIGSIMTLAVVLLQGGLREVLLTPGSPWALKAVELSTTVLGGGLLGGCIALILARLKQA